MRIPIATQSASGRSKPLTIERLVNMYAEKAPSGAKSPVVAHGCPGLTRFADIDTRRTRGLYRTPADGRLYTVVRNTLYFVDSDGNPTALGTIDGAGRVGMSDNGLQLCIVTGASGYTYSTVEGLQQITDPGFPGADTVTFLDGYFIFSNSTPGQRGQFFISSLLDGQVYDATEFATAESYPDNLLRVFADHSQLLLFGTETIEIWFNAGAADFPFVRAQGSVIEQGLGARWSVEKLDETVVWLDNEGMVRRLEGNTPVRISTHAIEYDISRGDWGNATAWSYVEEGHQFYVLTVPARDLATQKAGTYVFDAATQLWHERKSYRQDYSRSGFYARAYGKHITADIDIGRLYVQSLDVYEEDGEHLIAEMQFPQIQNDGRRFIVHRLQLDMEVGVGLGGTDQSITEDPYILLPLTYDDTDITGESTWSGIGDGPSASPEGFIGNNSNSRIEIDSVPSWLSAGDSPLLLHASVTAAQTEAKINNGDTIIHAGSDGAGTEPDARLAMRVLRSPGLSTEVYVALQGFTSSMQTHPLFRPAWKFQRRFPVLNIGSNEARPQGILFLSDNEVLVSAHFEDTESRAYKINANTGEVLGSFDFGSTYIHITAFAANSSGDVWCCDYLTNITLQIDVDASLSAGTVQILSEWDTNNAVTVVDPASGVSTLEFIQFGGVEYVLLGEYAETGTPALWVIPITEMGDGVVFQPSDAYKEFFIGRRLQGTAIKNGDLYAIKNRNFDTSNANGWLEIFPDIGSQFVNESSGSSLPPDSAYPAPSQYPEDMKFHPVTGILWTMTEGFDAIGDFAGFLSIWSWDEDGGSVENSVSARFNGVSLVDIKINNEAFDVASWTITTGADTISIGSAPNAAEGLSEGFFDGVIRGVRIQNNPLTDLEYSETVSGTLETRTLTEFPISVTNGGAETGNSTGWTDEVGALDVRSSNPQPFEGAFYFFGGQNAQTISRQRVDLIGSGLTAQDIDGGNAWVNPGWVQNIFDSSSDPGAIGIRLLDVSQVEISTQYSPIDSAGTQNWYRRYYPVSIPSGTRFIDILIRADRTIGTNNDAYFDDITCEIFRG